MGGNGGLSKLVAHLPKRWLKRNKQSKKPKLLAWEGESIASALG